VTQQTPTTPAQQLSSTEGTPLPAKGIPWTRVAWKGAFAMGYALVLTLIVITSELYAAFESVAPQFPLPYVPNPFPTSYDFLVALILTVLTLLPFVSKSKEMPALLALAGIVCIVTSYTYSTLDWTKLLKDFGLTKPGFPPWTFLLVCSIPFFAAMGLQFFENGRLLRESFETRGVPAADVRGVRTANLQAGLEVLGMTAAAFLVTGLGVWLLSLVQEGGGLNLGALAAPLIAGALLATILAIFLYVPRRGEKKRREAESKKKAEALLKDATAPNPLPRRDAGKQGPR